MNTPVLLAVRNARRNTRRSALTAATVLLGCALLTIGLSWVLGIQGSFIDASVRANGHVRLVSARFAERERLQPLYENIPTIAPLIEKFRADPEITAIYPRIQMGVAASVGGEEVGEVFGLLVGAPLAYFDAVLDLRPRVTAGRFFSEGEAAAGEALIGRLLAADMEVKPGDEAIFLGQTQDGSISPIKVTVAGIVDTGNGLFDKQVFVPLEKAQQMADIPEGSVELLLFTEDPGDAQDLMEKLRPRLPALAEAGGVLGAEGKPGSLAVSSWDTREPFASMLALARTVMGAVAVIIVFITALGVLNTMLMSVLERTAEIGVLRSLGMKRGAVVLMFVLEAVAIAALGGAVGAALGSLASILMERTGVDLGTLASNLPDTLPANRVLHPDWSPALAGVAFGLGIVMAFIGSASPAFRAARIQPVTAMRSRR